MRARFVAAVAAFAFLCLTGCSKMDQALDKQWMVVQFGPHTTIATVLHVRAACSHVKNAPPMPLPAQHSVVNMMYGVRFDTTNASLADMSRLQTCLSQFKAVQGVNPESTGDEGS